jgi:hypothetical protein
MKADKATIVIAVAVLVVVSLSLVFLLNKPQITGYAVSTSLFVSGLIYPYNCNITLSDGWNLVSFPCGEMSNMGVTSVLQGIEGQYESIHSYYATDEEDPWKSYKPGLPSWVDQDLLLINTSRGYWINVLNSTSLNITGWIRLPATIPLESGWNLVGYPNNSSKTPQQAFSSINDSIASVHAYNSTDSADYWKVYAPSLNDSLNDLKLIIPNWGYWINATASADWVIEE